MEDNSKKGLGDQVENIINTIAPKMATRLKEGGCNCEKRKEWLNNNFRAIFG